MTERTAPNRYGELSERARWFLENFDELDLAEICASSERTQAALARVRTALDNAEWGGPDRADVINEIRVALEEPTT